MMSYSIPLELAAEASKIVREWQELPVASYDWATTCLRIAYKTGDGGYVRKAVESSHWKSTALLDIFHVLSGFISVREKLWKLWWQLSL